MALGRRHEQRAFNLFSLFVRRHTVLGLGRIQIGELPEPTVREWIPPSARPSPTPPSKKTVKPVEIEALWRQFFEDPSQWSDVRTQKINSKQPDWIHKKTKEALWIDSPLTPFWVKREICAIFPAQVFPDKRNRRADNDEHQPGEADLRESAARVLMDEQINMPSVVWTDKDTVYMPVFPPPRRSVEEDGRVGIGSDEDVRKLCLNGQPKNVLHILEQRGIDPGSYVYVCLLRRCTNIRDLAEGKHVHSHIVKSRFKPSTFVLNALLNMYMKCGSLEDARQVFNKMRERDMFAWTIMLSGYAKLGHPEEAYEIYEQMRKKGVPLDRITFTTVLTACVSLRDLKKGKKVHGAMIEAGVHPDTILANTLVDMYAKCGNIREAYQVFKQIADRDVVSWNVMIAGAAQNGYSKEAFDFFEEMLLEGLKPDKVTYVGILNACASLAQGKQLHSDIIEAGYELDVRVGTALVNMYSKCGSVDDALQVFDKLPKRNVVSWTSLIAAYSQNGEPEKALKLYEKMLEEGIVADKLVYTLILNICASLGHYDKGQQVLELMIRKGIAIDLITENTLIDMYAKCGKLKDARQYLKSMRVKDVVSYTALISGCVQHGNHIEALDVFLDMEREGVLPNSITFISLLRACANVGSLTEGKRIHARIAEAGLEADMALKNALFDMYTKCERHNEVAQEVAISCAG